MKILGLAILFFTGASSLPSIQFNESLDDFEEEFGVLTNDDAERQREETLLKKAEAEINENNEKAERGESTFTEKLYQDSLLSETEFEKEKEGEFQPPLSALKVTQRYYGHIAPPDSMLKDPVNEAKLRELYAAIDRKKKKAPYKYDADKLGLVTPPRNQRECGSCAAFAATGLHETCMLKAGAPKAGLDLSEQYVIDCGYDGRSMMACDGAWGPAYSRWLIKDGGVSPHEADYLYKNSEPIKDCSQAKSVKKWNSGAKVVDSAFDPNANEQKIKDLVFEHGAVMVSMYASESSFHNYNAGVYQGCSSEETNHAVLIVGYGKEKGVKYWKVKNSWGPHWGENGFVKIKRGNNECGIEKAVATATCQSTGSPDVAPTTPPPPPIPVALQCDISGMYGPITGNYMLTTTFNGKAFEAKVKCEKGNCTPANPGPSNACMYICGQVEC